MASDQRPDPFLQALCQANTVPLALRDLHSGQGVFRGRCDVERGQGFLIAIALRLGRFPKSGKDLPVAVVTRNDGENWHWTRDFAGQSMQSRLRFDAGRKCVEERLGRLTIWLRPVLTRGVLSIQVKRLSVFGIPCPSVLLPRSASVEWQDDQGRFCFDISASLPGLGRLIRYHGWLTRVHDDTGQS